MDGRVDFFEFAAKVGLTKHLGGLGTTEKLIELCHISRDKIILDVGCGAGVTPVFIAKTIGCKVVGVDISEGMVGRSNKRVKREHLSEKVELRIADAQDLPFNDNSFDAVITESVTAFPEDKQKAVNEYVRVTKPGGYIGLNESTWLKVPPPPELLAWASMDLGSKAKPLSASEWTGLLETAGLKEIITRCSEITVKDETRGLYQRYGFGGMLTVMFRMLSLYTRDREYRNFVKEVKHEGVTPKNLSEYFGYGIYVGRK